MQTESLALIFDFKKHLSFPWPLEQDYSGPSNHDVNATLALGMWNVTGNVKSNAMGPGVPDQLSLLLSSNDISHNAVLTYPATAELSNSPFTAELGAPGGDYHITLQGFQWEDFGIALPTATVTRSQVWDRMLASSYESGKILAGYPGDGKVYIQHTISQGPGSPIDLSKVWSVDKYNVTTTPWPSNKGVASTYSGQLFGVSGSKEMTMVTNNGSPICQVTLPRDITGVYNHNGKLMAPASGSNGGFAVVDPLDCSLTEFPAPNGAKYSNAMALTVQSPISLPSGGFAVFNKISSSLDFFDNNFQHLQSTITASELGNHLYPIAPYNSGNCIALARSVVSSGSASVPVVEKFSSSGTSLGFYNISMGDSAEYVLPAGFNCKSNVVASMHLNNENIQLLFQHPHIGLLANIVSAAEFNYTGGSRVNIDKIAIFNDRAFISWKGYDSLPGGELREQGFVSVVSTQYPEVISGIELNCRLVTQQGQECIAVATGSNAVLTGDPTDDIGTTLVGREGTVFVIDDSSSSRLLQEDTTSYVEANGWSARTAQWLREHVPGARFVVGDSPDPFMQQLIEENLRFRLEMTEANAYTHRALFGDESTSNMRIAEFDQTSSLNFSSAQTVTVRNFGAYSLISAPWGVIAINMAEKVGNAALTLASGGNLIAAPGNTDGAPEVFEVGGASSSHSSNSGSGSSGSGTRSGSFSGSPADDGGGGPLTTILVIIGVVAAVLVAISYGAYRCFHSVSNNSGEEGANGATDDATTVVDNPLDHAIELGAIGLSNTADHHDDASA